MHCKKKQPYKSEERAGKLFVSDRLVLDVMFSGSGFFSQWD